jgi:hypothetical protein
MARGEIKINIFPLENFFLVAVFFGGKIVVLTDIYSTCVHVFPPRDILYIVNIHTVLCNFLPSQTAIHPVPVPVPVLVPVPVPVLEPDLDSDQT